MNISIENEVEYYIRKLNLLCTVENFHTIVDWKELCDSVNDLTENFINTYNIDSELITATQIKVF